MREHQLLISKKIWIKYTEIIFPCLLALLFGLIFVFFPWSKIQRVAHNPDIDEYLTRIYLILMGSDTQLKDLSLLTLAFSEPIWASMLALIGIYFDEPYNGLLLISFFCIFIFTFFLSKKINIFLAFFFLLNPLVFDLLMGQVRSAFSMALFLVAVMAKRRTFCLFFLIAAILIHSAIFLILAIYILAKIFERMQIRLDYKLIGFFTIS